MRYIRCQSARTRMLRVAGSRPLRNIDPRARSVPRLYSSSLSSSVRIIEVGPRDGLQNIKTSIPTATKIELIKRLADTGLRDIEATSFVSPKWVPQLADGAQVMKEILPMRKKRPELRFPVLAPNLKGLENAHKAGATEIVVFASVTEAFSKANQNCTIEEALTQAETVTRAALRLGIRVRGATSCIYSDPFAGPTPPELVLPVVQRFLDMGCHEVSLGDTLGVGTAWDTQKLLEILLRTIPANKLAGHFHDTYSQGVSNVARAYDMGVRTFDSSVAGLGGCPYAPGAKGNVGTEELIYTLEKAGINTGVDLDKLIAVGQWISKELGQPYESRVGGALTSKCIPTKAPTPASKPTRSWTILEDTGEYRVSSSGTARKITLTRPDKGNTLTYAMLEGLTTLFRNLANDPTVYQVVLESEGKFFCTGMDLSGATRATEQSYYQKVHDLYEAIDHMPQTTIAVVDGPCFGGGVGLTFACDVRIVSPHARWTLSEVKIGVSPAIISKYLVREWGASMAREGVISGREILPEELHRIGAIHTISDAKEPLEIKLDKYLDQLEKCAPRSVAINKELTRLGWYAPESRAQSQLIEKTFADMMVPGSEGEHGIGQFQKKVKSFSWKDFWSGRSPIEGLGFGSRSNL